MELLQLSVAAKNKSAVASARRYEFYDFDIPYAFRFTKFPYPSLIQLDQSHTFDGDSLRTLAMQSPFTPPIGSSPGVDDLFRPRQTPLRGRISGRLDIQGYLALIGVGQARAEVNATLLDIGPVGSTVDGDTHFSLARHKVLDKEISTNYEPRLGFGYHLEGGSDYEGGGTGIHAEYKVPMKQLNILQNDVDFGFDVTLQRGRRYRLEINLLGEAGLHTVGLGLGDNSNDNANAREQGRAIVSFYDVEPATTPFQNDFKGLNLGERWEDIWGPIDTDWLKLRNIDFTNGGGPPFPFFDNIDFLLFHLLDDNFQMGTVPQISDFGVNDLQNGLDGLANRHFPDFATNQANPLNIPQPGVKTDHISILLEHDQVDFMDKFERREIEGYINANLPDLANLKTPMFDPRAGAAVTDPWSGRFELAYDIVIQLANGAWEFIPTGDRNQIIGNIQQARAAAAGDDYRAAFGDLHDAYSFLP